MTCTLVGPVRPAPARVQSQLARERGGKAVDMASGKAGRRSGKADVRARQQPAGSPTCGPSERARALNVRADTAGSGEVRQWQRATAARERRGAVRGAVWTVLEPSGRCRRVDTLAAVVVVAASSLVAGCCWSLCARKYISANSVSCARSFFSSALWSSAPVAAPPHPRPPFTQCWSSPVGGLAGAPCVPCRLSRAGGGAELFDCPLVALRGGAADNASCCLSLARCTPTSRAFSFAACRSRLCWISASRTSTFSFLTFSSLAFSSWIRLW
mmetsp:Transcript_9032/g.22697  ORF Transcript_9032/g.22697 Transcript_9032/m.22697 type:complete len:271 (-) Transcript_9032:330-1142(-)